jgi:transposase
MSLRPEPLLPIPDVTAAAVRAAFPKGNLYVDLRTEFGTLYEDQLFADLYPPEGRPVEVAPWRLALVVVMQYIEGLCRKFSFEAICGMISPSNPCGKGGERRWRSASKGLISLTTSF